MSGDITVTSTMSGKAIGIGADTSSDVTITGLEDLSVKANNGIATGISATNQSSADISMDGDITVSAANGSAFGVTAQGDSNVVIYRS